MYWGTVFVAKMYSRGGQSTRPEKGAMVRGKQYEPCVLHNNARNNNAQGIPIMSEYMRGKLHNASWGGNE